jgi:hypothetical protein
MRGSAALPQEGRHSGGTRDTRPADGLVTRAHSRVPRCRCDSEQMSLTTALSIAVPAVALLVVVAARGELRWIRRPWFVKGEPRRLMLGVLFGLLLAVALVRAVA